ncbi:MAG: hypothetical protein IPK50_06880 [Fibrobacterota bacterium]|nr:hypothetical protein [Fibrobacterota bacterium]QQS06617.1 MAG: hypothetical protein IPK50_06880 [Fibrobacterota bacterium]
MRLVCEVGLDDIIAFNQFYHKHSSLGDRARRVQKVALFVIVASLGYSFWEFGVDMMIAVPIAVFMTLGIGYFLFGKKISYSHQVARSVRVIYEDPAMKATLGEKVVEFDGEWIIESSENFQIRARIAALHAIDVEGGRVFIQANPVTTIIIPWNKVTEGDAIAFLDALQTLCPEKVKAAIPQDGAGMSNSGNPYQSPGV